MSARLRATAASTTGTPLRKIKGETAHLLLCSELCGRKQTIQQVSAGTQQLPQLGFGEEVHNVGLPISRLMSRIGIRLPPSPRTEHTATGSIVEYGQRY
jgi:hypothetical protein